MFCLYIILFLPQHTLYLYTSFNTYHYTFFCIDEEEWKDAEDLDREFQHPFNEFDGYKGVSPNFIEELLNEDVGKFFEVLVDKEIIDMIVNATNGYATKTLIEREDTPSTSRLHSWNPTDSEEISKFLGVVMYMGVIKMPRISDYWKTDEFHKNSFVPKIMSRNRFELLLKMIHFCEPEDEE